MTNSEIERIVSLYKNRLLSFGFEFIAPLAIKYHAIIEVIDHTEKTEEQELGEDMIEIVTVFSCRLQDKRDNQAKKMIREFVNDDHR